MKRLGKDRREAAADRDEAAMASPRLRVYRVVISLTLAAVAVFALTRLLTLRYAVIGNGYSIVWLVLWALCALTVNRAIGSPAAKRTRVIAAVTGALFAAFSALGYQLNLRIFTGAESIGLADFADFALQTVGLAILYTAVLVCLFQFFLTHGFSAGGKSPSWFTANRRSFLLVWLVILFCWLPYYVIYFPGAMSFDSVEEVTALLTLETADMTNHHPFIHMMTIKPFLLLGQALGSVTAGVGLYSLFQMLAMAAIFSVCVWYLAKRDVNVWARALLLAYFALLPTNALYSITVWKDILFAGFTLLAMILLFDEVRAPAPDAPLGGGKPRVWRTFALVAVLFLFCVYRNNGYYSFLVAFPFFILINRKRWKRFLSVGLIVVVLVTSYQHLIFHGLGVAKSRSGEALSIPLQQIARTVKTHGDEISEEDYAILSEVIPQIETYGDLYTPPLADPVKTPDVFLSDVFSENPLRYLKVWLHIGLQHPRSYVFAFFPQNFGYWYPDAAHWIVYTAIHANDFGIAREPAFHAARVAINTTYEQLREVTLLSMLFSIGFMVWIVILSAGILLAKRRGRLASPLLLLGGLWLTTCASPVFCEYRYIYGLIVSAPLCLFLALRAEPALPAPPVETERKDGTSI